MNNSPLNMKVILGAILLTGAALMVAATQRPSDYAQEDCLIENFRSQYRTCREASKEDKVICMKNLNEFAKFCVSKPHGVKNFGPLASANRFWEGLTLAADLLRHGRPSAVMEFLYEDETLQQE